MLAFIGFLATTDPHAAAWLLGFLFVGTTIVTATIKHWMTVILDQTGGAVATNKGRVTADDYDNTYTLTPVSTPAVSKQASFLLTLSSGALSIDLTNLTDLATGAIVDGTGLKVIGFRMKNLGANSMTVVGGASSGYLLFGTAGKVVLPASGGEVSFYTAGNTVVAVDGTHKTLDVTGTGAQTAEVTVLLG